MNSYNIELAIAQFSDTIVHSINTSRPYDWLILVVTTASVIAYGYYSSVLSKIAKQQVRIQRQEHVKEVYIYISTMLSFMRDINLSIARICIEGASGFESVAEEYNAISKQAAYISNQAHLCMNTQLYKKFKDLSVSFTLLYPTLLLLKTNKNPKVTHQELQSAMFNSPGDLSILIKEKFADNSDILQALEFCKSKYYHHNDILKLILNC